MAEIKTKTKLQFAANRYNCYPGELIAFHFNFNVEKVAGISLQAVWPQVVNIESYDLPEGVPVLLPSVAEVDQNILMIVPLEKYFSPNQEYDIVVYARINTFYINQNLTTEAQIVDVENEEIIASEAVRISVFGKGKYLRYLPEIYNRDDFLSRYLMFFESFWKPIDTQVSHIHHYFDPQLTPKAFIPWLASWVGMPMDDFLPIERTRNLLNNALLIYQLRGTLQALQLYLEIYTEGEVQISEHRASNFTLGKQNRLGLERALGRENKPVSVSVDMTVAKSELTRTRFTKEMYLQKMREIIRSMVPAHITYDVRCEFIQ